jgi:hypothetical protein
MIQRTSIGSGTQVFRTRDVIFNEDVVYGGKTDPSEIRLISVAQLRDTIMEPDSVLQPEEYSW